MLAQEQKIVLSNTMSEPVRPIRRYIGIGFFLFFGAWFAVLEVLVLNSIMVGPIAVGAVQFLALVILVLGVPAVWITPSELRWCYIARCALGASGFAVVFVFMLNGKVAELGEAGRKAVKVAVEPLLLITIAQVVISLPFAKYVGRRERS